MQLSQIQVDATQDGKKKLSGKKKDLFKMLFLLTLIYKIHKRNCIVCSYDTCSHISKPLYVAYDKPS